MKKYSNGFEPMAGDLIEVINTSSSLYGQIIIVRKISSPNKCWLNSRLKTELCKLLARAPKDHNIDELSYVQEKIAYAYGYEIECMCRGSFGWEDCPDPCWEDDFCYRIKPIISDEEAAKQDQIAKVEAKIAELQEEVAKLKGS